MPLFVSVGLSGLLWVNAPLRAVAESPDPAAQAAAASNDESEFVRLVGDLRAEYGVGPLQPDGELRRVASAWTLKMTAAGKISHNPNLGTDFHGAWKRLGENVGKGGSVQAIEDAFERSPAHLRNLIDPDFDAVSVTVVRDGGLIFVTQQFLELPDAPSPSAPDALALTRAMATRRLRFATPAGSGTASTGPAPTSSATVVTQPSSGPSATRRTVLAK